VRTASQLVDEIALDVLPPQGVAIVLTERSGLPNWLAAAGAMDMTRTGKFSAKVAALTNLIPLSIGQESLTTKARIDGSRSSYPRLRIDGNSKADGSALSKTRFLA
jgi:hypothetical protein